ncbi:DNA cytosine methyltransferase [Stenotrophomonas maltophilia]|uniref:DNA cytosine methyltransferase n=1 Tax=Stenotrophomonas maltophilia TaxID=40324 RepID=UPI00021E0B57|nr:DNA cytosine methyltransferase [Stenotrophomonas maltophilia]AEM49543.1 DNA-cytosine methyltransferase [Stenotrophomonas maltophilia JV3]
MYALLTLSFVQNQYITHKPDSNGQMKATKVIDLFSGVGGLSLGAARAGFHVAGSVEIDPIASASHSMNFPGTNHFCGDVAGMSGKEVLAKFNVSQRDLAGIIGGPPCQGFSLIGRRDEEDPRNQLFGEFFRIVSEAKPLFFVAENVPGILSPKSKSLVDAALSHVKDTYTLIPPVRIRASDYGAPTTRTRIFFIGVRTAVLKDLPEDFFKADVGTERITVGRALRGLPDVDEDWQDEEASWRKVRAYEQGEFEKRLFGIVPNGVGEPEALRRMKSRLVSGFLGTKHMPETVLRFSKLSSGEVDSVYRSPRLDPRGFCPTLRAGTNSDRGSYQAVRPIHPRKPRVISPREAARLQGFPDWFVFHPTKWHSFRQIGNSVSPIVAEFVLKKVRELVV